MGEQTGAHRPEIEPQLHARVKLMNRSVPDCLVENHETLFAVLFLPDADDWHVLAAAIAGPADAIVTFNLKDFQPDVLDLRKIVAIHPDDFVLNQLELRPYEVLPAVKKKRARLTRPPRSAAELIAMLERSGLPVNVALLLEAQTLI